MPRLLLSLGLMLWATGLASGADAPVDFRRDILPILSDRCFACHGPDAHARQADLRLDTRLGLFRAEDPTVVPAHPDESELIRRVESDDLDERMPPPASKLTLAPDEAATLRRWVAEGAPWADHWAFEAPRRPELPPARPGGSAHPIDRLVGARLGSIGLGPAPEADRATLIRRVVLDLTGLPPTTEEVDTFLLDREPGAYERVVDRALGSFRHAERLATDWLDLARYADTIGYQADRAVAVWPWRDWVVRAIAANMPYDRFVTWQLAGDLLPGSTREQTLATAFNRLHLQNEEGGIVAEEFRVAYVADRVHTMSTAFLGLTVECARCHDHKFDPISQRDYYSLAAFFGNIDESGQTSHFTQAVPVPALTLGDDASDARLADLHRRIALAEADLRARTDAPEDDAFRAWLADREGSRPDLPGLVGLASFDRGPGDHPADPARHLLAVHPIGEPSPTPGADGIGAELSGDDGFSFPGVGHFGRDDPFTLALWVLVPEGRLRDGVIVHHTKAPVDAGWRGYEIRLEGGHLVFGLTHMAPENAAVVRTEAEFPTDGWVRLAATSDGSGRAEGLRIFLDGRAVPLVTVRDGLTRTIGYAGAGEPDLTIGTRFRDSGFRRGRVDEFRVYDRALTPIEVADLAGEPQLISAWTTPIASLSDQSRRALLDLYRATADPATVAARAALRDLRRERSALVDALPEIMVMRELPTPRPAHVLIRGAYDAPGERVEADTPRALPPFPADQPRNRLGLARWLFAPGHPLTARVAVNRYWQMMFGRGLVLSSENLGRQGAAPADAELLDWLACEFATDWDVRRLLRLIATSQTYRQSSRAGADLLARDPGNTLLARGPARRLTAEMLRDQALSLAGLLDERRGGPPVRPYQPSGLYDVSSGGAGSYGQSHGGDLYRRTLYTFWKRTVPHPALLAFDAADRNNCAARRQATSTPLQALALLNDPQMVEAARHLAQLALKQGGADDDARASWTFRRVAGRPASDRERPVLVRLVAEQRAGFAADPDSARRLLAVGERPADPALDPVDLASFAALAQALLSHDAAVYRR